MIAKARRVVHNLFQVSIFLKAMNGVLQVILGVLIFAINPASLNAIVVSLTTYELSLDPQDWVSNHLLAFSGTYSTHTQLFAAIYLLSHGVIKLFLVFNLWQRKLWAYPTAITVFILFGIYQIYRYSFTHSQALIVLTVLDVAVIILTWLEYRNLKKSTVVS